MPRDSQTRRHPSPEPELWPAALEHWLAGERPSPARPHPGHDGGPKDSQEEEVSQP
jgi:hypothetical protein